MQIQINKVTYIITNKELTLINKALETATPAKEKYNDVTHRYEYEPRPGKHQIKSIETLETVDDKNTVQDE